MFHRHTSFPIRIVPRFFLFVNSHIFPPRFAYYPKKKDVVTIKRYLLLAAVTAAAIAALLTVYFPRPTAATVVTVTPQNAVKTVLCPGTVSDSEHVRVFVRESAANAVQTGQSVRVEGVGFAEPSYDGTVQSIADKATAQNGKIGLLAVVKLFSTDRSLKPGLTAAVRVTVASFADVTVIDEDCLHTDSDGTFVLVVADKKAARKPVTVGERVDNGVIVNGLTRGDRLLTAPADLRVGQAVSEETP